MRPVCYLFLLISLADLSYTMEIYDSDQDLTKNLSEETLVWIESPEPHSPSTATSTSYMRNITSVFGIHDKGRFKCTLCTNPNKTVRSLQSLRCHLTHKHIPQIIEYIKPLKSHLSETNRCYKLKFPNETLFLCKNYEQCHRINFCTIKNHPCNGDQNTQNIIVHPSIENIIAPTITFEKSYSHSSVFGFSVTNGFLCSFCLLFFHDHKTLHNHLHNVRHKKSMIDYLAMTKGNPFLTHVEKLPNGLNKLIFLESGEVIYFCDQFLNCNVFSFNPDRRIKEHAKNCTLIAAAFPYLVSKETNT